MANLGYLPSAIAGDLSVAKLVYGIWFIGLLYLN